MERHIFEKHARWKDSRYRKPLLLEGAHRVGKTWVLKTFGERCYENTVYVSFTENEAYKAIFEPNKDVDRIVAALAKATGRTIEPHRTLIVLDDIGECPKALNALKYFCEVAPQYHVACAATLPTMGFSRPASFPVGKVNLMRLDPMSFTEVLRAEGDANPHPHGHSNSDPLPGDPLDGLRTLHTLHTLAPIPRVLFDELFEKLACYLTTGGMPEAVFKAVFKTVLLRTEGAKENTTKHASESASESALELEHDADPVRSVLAESAKRTSATLSRTGRPASFRGLPRFGIRCPRNSLGQTKRSSTDWCGTVRGPARTRPPSDGWRRPAWCIASRAVPGSGFPLRPTTTAPRSGSIPRT